MNAQSFLAMLNDSALYKKQVKTYKQGILAGDLPIMLVVTEVIQQCLEKRMEYEPVCLLNAVRFLKETVDRRTSEEAAQYIDLVAERAIPEMGQAALFKKESKDEDRGKSFFSPNPTSDVSIYGNSFFHLLLECLLVWGSRFENTLYSDTLAYLVSEGVTFPTSLNYFKDQSDRNLTQSSLNLMQSQLRVNSNVITESNNLQQNQQQQQHHKNKQEHVDQKYEAVNVNSLHNANEFTKAVAPILNRFAELKQAINTVLLAMSKFEEGGDLFRAFSLVEKYDADFKALIEKAFSIDSTTEMGEHLNTLITECDFCSEFISDYNSLVAGAANPYGQASIAFDEVVAKYTKQSQQQLRASQQGTPSGGSNIHENHAVNHAHANNHSAPSGLPAPIEEVEDEEERKENLHALNNQQHKKQEQHHASKQQVSNVEASGTPTPTHAYYPSQQEQVNGMNSNRSYQSEAQSGNGANSFQSQQSFRTMFTQRDMDKYKVEMLSSSNFKKSNYTNMSQIPSNQNSFSQASVRSAIIKKPTQEQAEEIGMLRRQIEELTAERDMWRDKYSAVANEIQAIRQQDHHQ